MSENRLTLEHRDLFNELILKINLIYSNCRHIISENMNILSKMSSEMSQTYEKTNTLFVSVYDFDNRLLDFMSEAQGYLFSIISCYVSLIQGKKKCLIKKKPFYMKCIIDELLYNIENKNHVNDEENKYINYVVYYIHSLYAIDKIFEKQEIQLDDKKIYSTIDDHKLVHDSPTNLFKRCEKIILDLCKKFVTVIKGIVMVHNITYFNQTNIFNNFNDYSKKYDNIFDLAVLMHNNIINNNDLIVGNNSILNDKTNFNPDVNIKNINGIKKLDEILTNLRIFFTIPNLTEKDIEECFIFNDRNKIINMFPICHNYLQSMFINSKVIKLLVPYTILLNLKFLKLDDDFHKFFVIYENVVIGNTNTDTNINVTYDSNKTGQVNRVNNSSNKLQTEKTNYNTIPNQTSTLPSKRISELKITKMPPPPEQKSEIVKVDSVEVDNPEPYEVMTVTDIPTGKITTIERKKKYLKYKMKYLYCKSTQL